MALLDKLKEELDKAAQALGYAVFRAKQGGGDVDSDTYTRLSATLATHDAEAAKYEAQLEDLKKQNRMWGSSASTSTPASATASAASDPAAAPEAGVTSDTQDVAG